MRPLIILHGAWHQPAHFDGLVERLRGQGVEVAVPDLAGRSLAQSTQLVQGLVDQSAQEPVVLAHSFGGVTASGLQRVHHLLFLNSFIFDVGESPQDWIERVERETGRQAAPLPLSVDEDGITHLEPEGAREGLFADCREEVAELAVGLLRPEPGSIFTEAASRAAWKEIPSTYIAGDQDRAIVPEMVAYFAERCGERLVWPTSHSPYLSCPDDVAALVRDHL